MLPALVSSILAKKLYTDFPRLGFTNTATPSSSKTDLNVVMS